jgi:PKD repeat protein
MVDFEWGPEYPRTNEPVYFQDNSAGAISRHWKFGDGQTSSEKNPIHYYAEEGIYNVTLTIYGSGETASLTRSIEIWDNWPPEAIATPELYAGNNPAVCFDGSNSWDPDGTIASYLWDFKDGYTSSQMSPCHTYNDDGIYFVSLTITDNDGKTDTTYCEIRIDVHTPPETEVILQGSIGNNGWFKSSVQVVFSAYDWTGVDYTMYSIDYGDWKYFSSPEKLYVDGDHNVRYYSVDVYGTIEDTQSVDFRMDSVKPTLDVEIVGEQSGEWYVSPVTVTCDASDGRSGLYGIFYKFEDTLFDDEWSLYEGPFTIDQDGDYILRIYSEDIAGNTRGKGTPYLMKIDTGAPTTICNLIGEGSNGNYYMEVDVELFADDPGSGVDTIFYQIDGGQWTEYTNIITITSHGLHTFEYYSVDMLGNEEAVNSIDFTINNINFNLAITNPENGLYLFGNKFINLQKTIIIGAITVEATLTPYGETAPDVDYVEFLVDGVSKTTVESVPFEWTWDETTFGKHTLKTVAYNDGESIEDSIEVMAFIL